MHVVYVHSFPLPSKRAHALQILQTAGALARRGHRVEVSVKSPDQDVDRHAEALIGPLPEGLTVRNLGVTRFAGTAYRLALLQMLIAGEEDLVFLGRQLRQSAWLLRWRQRLRRRAPLIYEFHNLEHVLEQNPERARLIERTERFVATHADALIAISTPLAEDLAELDPASSPHVIEDGADCAAFAHVSPDDPCPPHQLAYAGGLYGHKGVDRLMDMMSELDASYRLRIVGGNDPSDLARLRARCADDPELRDRVQLVGHVAPEDVPQTLHGAQLLLLPAGEDARAERYTSPLKLFEYLATGIPIVAAPTASFRSVLDDRVAFFAASGEGTALAEAVRGALRDPQEWRRRGRAARERSATYSWDHRATRVARVLERSLSPRETSS